MFERFTERARQVVVLAQDEARRLQHNYIGTEHLLLGLLREEEGIAARVLGSLGVTADEVRAEVERVVGQGDEVPTGRIPFTPRAKHALERSLREALALGHKHIGTEHVLLGVVSEENGVAARILEVLGERGEGSGRGVPIAPRRSGASQFEPVLPDAPLETRPVVAPWIVTSAASLGAGLLRLAYLGPLNSRAMTAPKRFPDRDEVAAVRAAAEGLDPGEEAEEKKRVAGRVLGRRGHGKLTFLDLADRSGTLQLLCSEERAGPVDVDLGDFVGATGSPARTKRGEPSLAVDQLDLLAKIKRPLPDTFHGLVDAETRYRKRYLDLLVNEETRRDFLLRSRIVAAVRRYLDERGFVEVETPVLQPRYGGGFAEAFVTHSNELDSDLYLRIATELYLKRLIVGGLEKVYEIGKDFRNESVSYKHQPEFTMLEWYEAYADYRDTMERIEDLVATVAGETIGTPEVVFRGHTIDLKAPWRRLTLVDALEEHDAWTRDEGDLRSRLEAKGIDTGADKSWAQLVDHALSHLVEPELIQPTILCDYPVELSPFARPTDDDPTLTERFEYFIGGMELGNAFTEINDSDEQAERFAMQAQEVGGEQGDPDYVEALSYGMPPTGGIGLGIDRLTMVLTGRETIRDVQLFPALRPRG